MKSGWKFVYGQSLICLLLLIGYLSGKTWKMPAQVEICIIVDNKLHSRWGWALISNWQWLCVLEQIEKFHFEAFSFLCTASKKFLCINSFWIFPKKRNNIHGGTILHKILKNASELQKSPFGRKKIYLQVHTFVEFGTEAKVGRNLS